MGDILRNVDDVTSTAKLVSVNMIHANDGVFYGDDQLFRLFEMPEFHGHLP